MTKKILSMILAIVMVVSLFAGITLTASAAESVTLSFAGGEATNYEELPFNDAASGVSAVFAKNTHSTAPRWDSTCVRFYGTSTMTNTLTVSAPAGGTVTSIVFAMNGTYTLNAVSADSGTIDTATFTWTGSAAAVVFTSTAQTRIEGITVTYTGTACAHANQSTNTVDATCETDGATTVTCNDCGAVLETTVIPATGHNYVDGVCSVCGAAEPVLAGYVKTDLANITSTQKVIITMSKDGTVWAMSNDKGASAAPSAVVVTVEGDTLKTDATNLDWNIANDNGSFVVYPAGDTASWLYITNTNNGVRVGTGEAKTFTIDATSGYISGVAGTTTRYLGVYTTTPDWRCYSNTTGNTANQTLAFYALQETTGDCAHTNVVEVAAVAPSCTVAGATAGTKCGDCGKILSGCEIVDALGHSYSDVTTEPTCGTAGLTTSTCSVCGDVQTTTIPATGLHNFVDGFCDVCGAEDLDFSGTYYIAAIRSSGNYMYMSNDLGTASTLRFQAVDSTLTALPEAITEANSAYTFVITRGEDRTYTITDVNGKYVSWTSGNSGALADDPAYVNITASATEGLVNISLVADSTRILALNNTATNNFFAFYAGTQVKDLALVPVEGEVHTHEYTAVITPATCTEAGSVVYTCSCGDSYTETIDMLPHDYVDGVCAECGALEPAAPEGYVLATVLNENDEVIIYYPTGALALTATASGSKLAGTAATPAEGVLAATADMAIMTVRYVDGSATDFYLISNNSYLTSGATGNSLTFAAEVTDYAVWYLEVADEAGGLVYIHNRNAAYNGNGQSLEYYNGFTTYGTKTTDVYKFQLYTKAGEAPSCEHVWGDWAETTPATCTTDGVQSRSCTLCGEVQTSPIAATGHTYVYGETAITCSACDYNVAYTLSDIATVKASSDGAVYYFKGVVTYVSGKTIYVEDNTAGICVYFTNDTAAAGIALGDEILVWDTITVYNGLIETTYTTSQEYVKVSEGNALPNGTATLAEILADTTNEYLSERVTISGLTMGTIVPSGNTVLTDAEGNTIVLFKASGMAENVTEGDTVTVTAIVSSYNGYQLLVNPGTITADVVVTAEAAEGEPALEDYSGNYYIAAQRSSGNYWYMTADQSTGTRYTALDTGLTELPATITDALAIRTFTVAKNEDGTYTIQAYGNENGYLSYNAGSNSGTLVAAADALPLTFDGSGYSVNVTYKVSDTETRYLSLNSNAGSDYFAFYKGTQINTLVLIPVEGEITACAHANTTVEGAVEATCTTEGYTGDIVCSDCGLTVTEGTVIEMLAHDYVDGICSECGASDPSATDYSGDYYIAAMRTGTAAGNYFYMTSDLGTASTSRYTALDTGLTELPAAIETGDADKTFSLIKNEDGTYYLKAYGIEEGYLGWTSGKNNGVLVGEADAVKLTVTEVSAGVFNFSFVVSETETRYLSLNNTTGNDYFAFYKPTQVYALSLIPVTAVGGGEVEPETMTIYFQNNWLWTDVCLYYWYADGSFDTAWPGAAMELHGNDGTYDIYKLAVPTNITGMIINGIKNDGTGDRDQTPDIESGWYDGICYYMLWSDGNTTGSEHIDVILPPACQHESTTTTTVEATCTTDGSVTVTCDACGEVLSTEVIESTGHDYTYTNNGENHTVGCSNGCGYSVTEGHTYENGACICGAVEVTGPAQADIKISHTVSFDSDLKMNYRIKYSNIAAVIPNYVTEGAYLVVEKDQYLASGEFAVDTVTLYPDLETDPTRMLFNLSGIQSVEMGSELRAVLHIFDAEGKEYVTPVDAYSVLDYAQLFYDTYTYEQQPELYVMLIDALNYGSAAQVYFGRRADLLVNAGMDAYQQYATTELSAPLEDSKVTETNDRTITAVSKIGFSVTFADKTEMNARLTIASGYSKSDITSVKVLNAAGEVVDTLTEFTELADGRLQVTYYGVKSVQMRDRFYFVAYVGDEVASDNVGYSIEAYAKSNITSSDANLADMVLKCMYYGDSAYAYFNR